MNATAGGVRLSRVRGTASLAVSAVSSYPTTAGQSVLMVINPMTTEGTAAAKHPKLAQNERARAT